MGNDTRPERERVLFSLVVGVVVAGLMVGFRVALEVDNADAGRCGQGVVTLLLGVAGGGCGDFTGRSDK